jgi:hypothetical protein
MDYYPENTVAKYTTKLSSSIELEGDWEVGLTEISTPLAVENVLDGYCYYIIYANGAVNTITLEPTHYRKLRDLINDLNERQRQHFGFTADIPLLVSFWNRNNKVSLAMRKISESTRIGVELSPDLARLLGFDYNVKYLRDMTAIRAPDLKGLVTPIYVYCDLLEHITVGDTKAPLLRILSNSNRMGYEVGNFHKAFNPTLYVPLQKKNFDTIEINLMTDTGLPVPFMRGKSFVVLEFRRAIYSHLTI